MPIRFFLISLRRADDERNVIEMMKAGIRTSPLQEMPPIKIA
jgi:hypothetical protein